MKKNHLIIFATSLVLIAAIVFAVFVGDFHKSPQKRELERITNEIIKKNNELNAISGRGVLLVERTWQEGFDEVQIDFVDLAEPGFVVVTGKDNPDVVIEPTEYKDVHIDWGVTKLLQPGEYNSLVVAQNLEQTKVDENILRYSVWRDNGDGVFNKETDSFIRKHDYMLSGGGSSDGRVSVPYVKIEEPSFLLISGTYKEKKFNRSKIDAMNVVGVTPYLKKGTHKNYNIPLTLNLPASIPLYEVDVTVWFDNGDQVFDKYTDKHLYQVQQDVRLHKKQ